MLFMMFIEDLLFHLAHRLLHWRAIYPYIHKIHHEYNSSVGIAAEYSHPIEFLFTSYPSIAGAEILRSRMHTYTYFVWVVIRIWETVDGHCGYSFPWVPFRLFPLQSPGGYHEFHHSHNVGNYSSFFTIWDTLTGSNKSFYNYMT